MIWVSDLWRVSLGNDILNEAPRTDVQIELDAALVYRTR